MITEQQVVVTSVLVCLVGLIAFTIGLWVGHGREREYVDQLEEELGQLLALGERPPEVAHEGPRQVVLPRLGMAINIEHEAWLKHADQAPGGKLHDIHGGPGENCWCGYVGHDPVLVPSVVIPPDPDASVTAWTKAMAADMDRFITGLVSQTDEMLREITR